MEYLFYYLAMRVFAPLLLIVPVVIALYFISKRGDFK